MRDTSRALALALDRDVNDIKAGVEALTASRYLDGRGDLPHFYEEAATVSKGFGGWAQSGAVTFTAGSASDGMSMARRVRRRAHLRSRDAGRGRSGCRPQAQIVGGGGRLTLPALALSAYARAEDRDRALTVGFDLYMTKPVEPSDLVWAVARLARR